MRSGSALHRPALLPVPGSPCASLYGEMAEIVTAGARVVPAKPLVLGYEFRHPELDEALRTALARERHARPRRAVAQAGAGSRPLGARGGSRSR